MGAVQPEVLLLMLAVLGTGAAPAPEDCHNLTKALTDVQKVSGEWVLVWSISDNTTDMTEWRNLTSSHVELRIHADGVEYLERNMFLGNSCISFYSNLSAASDGPQVLSFQSSRSEKNGVITLENDNGTVKFYDTCADCVFMEYNGDFGRFLLIYRRYGLHQNVEDIKAIQIDSQNLAECLGFPQNEPFIYDGVTDFCHKKSSPGGDA